jgi:hypothetical protein
MANLLNSVSSEFGRLMLEYETICIQSIVKSITVSLSHSSEAAQKQQHLDRPILHSLEASKVEFAVRSITSGSTSHSQEQWKCESIPYEYFRVTNVSLIRRTLRQDLYVGPATIQMEVQMLSISRLSMMIAFGLQNCHWMGFIFRTEPGCLLAVTLKAKFIFCTPYYSVVATRELKEIGISLQPAK